MKINVKKAALIINTNSRIGEKSFFEILDKLEQQGIAIESSYPVRNVEYFDRAIKESINKGYKLIIVGGGDGTLSSVVNYFAYKDLILGVLPLGTGNSFARSLELPLDIDGMVETIAKGKVAKVNLGRVGERYFANVISMGFNAKVAKHTPNKLKKYLSFIAYGLVGLKLFINKPSFTAQILIRRQWLKSKANQIIVANGSFFGITKIYPAAHIDNNELIVCTIDAKSRLQIVRSWIGFMLGRPKLFSGVKLISVQDVTIKSNPIQKVDIDGEASSTTPVRIQLAKEALQVMVPQSFQDKE